MIKNRSVSAVLFLFTISLYGLFLFSCRNKPMEGMLVCTQVSGKIQAQTNWKDEMPARIVALDPSHIENSLKVLTEGYFSAHSPEISSDGKSMLFVGKQKEQDTWKIFEMNLENLKIRQVTSFDGDCTNPVNLPNGRFVYGLNVGKDSENTGNPLFTSNPDGSDPRQISYSPNCYLTLTVLKDGRVLAFDKTASSVKQKTILMILRPDGTKSELFYEGIAGSSLISRASETENGKIVFIESAKNKSDIICIRYNRPLHSRVNLTSGIKGDFQSVFSMPSGKLLVSYRPSGTGPYSVYEFDPETKTLGKPVFSDPAYHVTEITMAYKHERPKKLPSEVDLGVKTGLLLCQDINFINSDAAENQALQQKAVAVEVMGVDSSMGVVPVEKDGSFQLKVVADKPFRLRSLDENGKVLNQSCEWMWIRPNERRGCVGCHEDHEQTPENRVPLAVKKPPVNVPVHIEKIKEKKVSLE